MPQLTVEWPAALSRDRQPPFGGPRDGVRGWACWGRVYGWEGNPAPVSGVDWAARGGDNGPRSCGLYQWEIIATDWRPRLVPPAAGSGFGPSHGSVKIPPTNGKGEESVEMAM
jgi:hypothetical protein